jgi:fumarate hydratase class I
MIKISTSKIKEAIKALCQKSATSLDRKTYALLSEAYNKETNQDSKEIIEQILQNAFISNKNQRPICQDTGQVIVFLEIGQDVHITDGNLTKAINEAVAESYTENYFRKSVNTSISRENTTNNTPAIIHTEIVDGEEIKITACLKGGGSENMSQSAMLYPAQGKEGILNFILNTVKKASLKSCPPMVIGVGIGGNLEKSAINSKKALTQYRENTELEKEFLAEVNKLNIGASGKGGNATAIDLKIIEEPCHIASLPVSVSLNCHASRHSSAIIGGTITYDFEKYEIKEINVDGHKKEVKADDIETIKKLKTGEKILLTGKIYTARDAAHKRLLSENQKPFEIKNAIIFYAGPCPAAPNEIIGPIGPTTSTRMDDYTEELLQEGLLATIGKGERREEIIKAHQKHGAIYFTATGGVASLLAQSVKSCKLIAYEDLGPEAIYELYVEKMPLFVDCGNMDK